ncbi:RHS repeat domain-containing protein [Saccharothrix sp. HUAS TT1]|uniref:RHS repeat domain-containing protein n=1 Tax=unclassified Saccharothrix TaxID=2593673 RepID=UPI00345BAE20
MGRPTTAIQRKFGVEQWRTTTSYGGDRVKTTPPLGGTATTLINDAQGRTVEKRRHTAGVDSPFDTTTYTYNAAGMLGVLTDPAGNQWRYTYDLRGRLVAPTTPTPATAPSPTTPRAKSCPPRARSGDLLPQLDQRGAGVDQFEPRCLRRCDRLLQLRRSPPAHLQRPGPERGRRRDVCLPQVTSDR